MRVLDPVCGMTIEDTDAAGSFPHEGTVYHFCSGHCLENFRRDPGQFLIKKTILS